MAQILDINSSEEISKKLYRWYTDVAMFSIIYGQISKELSCQVASKKIKVALLLMNVVG